MLSFSCGMSTDPLLYDRQLNFEPDIFRPLVWSQFVWAPHMSVQAGSLLRRVLGNFIQSHRGLSPEHMGNTFLLT